jgi:hypothetical protein
VLINGVHRLTGALRVAGAADHRPALRQRIDLAFEVCLRAKRFATVKIGAPIPLAVPCIFLDISLQLLRLRQATLRETRVPTPARNFSKLPEHVVKKEREPDAFAAAFFSHQVHPVIPIAGAHQGQTVLAEFQSMLDRAHTMLVERGNFLGAIR